MKTSITKVDLFFCTLLASAWFGLALSAVAVANYKTPEKGDVTDSN